MDPFKSTAQLDDDLNDELLNLGSATWGLDGLPAVDNVSFPYSDVVHLDDELPSFSNAHLPHEYPSSHPRFLNPLNHVGEADGGISPWDQWTRSTPADVLEETPFAPGAQIYHDQLPTPSPLTIPPAGFHTVSIEGAGEPSARPHRCLGCKAHKGNRHCFGYPLCGGCAPRLPLLNPSTSCLDEPFLNWPLWFSTCVHLKQQLLGWLAIPDEKSRFFALQSRTIIMELEFEDRAFKRDIQKMHSVVFDLRLSPETFRSPQTDDFRAPAISNTQFDSFVIEAMWDSEHFPKKEPGFSEREQELFSTVKLLLGYMSLLRNLDSTWINNSAYLADALNVVVAAELIYFLAFRLNMLLREFSSKCPSLGDRFIEARPAIIHYALEVMYLGMQSMAGHRWSMPETDSFHPLRQLQEDFHERTNYIIDRILTYECHLSGQNEEARRTPNAPPLLVFARRAEKCLPRYLVVTAQIHMPLSPTFDPFPLMRPRPGNRSIIDVLATSHRCLTCDVANGSIIPRNRFPEYLVTEDNSKVYYRLLTMEHEIHEGSKFTYSSTGGPTNPKQDLFTYDTDLPPTIWERPYNSDLLTFVGKFNALSPETNHPMYPPTIPPLNSPDLGATQLQLPERWATDFNGQLGLGDANPTDWNLAPDSYPLEQRKRQRPKDGSEPEIMSDVSYSSKRAMTYLDTLRFQQSDMKSVLIANQISISTPMTLPSAFANSHVLVNKTPNKRATKPGLAQRSRGPGENV